jgi:hypothetical protein
MRRLAAVLCVGVLIAAGAASAGDLGYHRHTVPGAGVSLALPSSWKALSAVEAKKLLGSGTFVRDNPQVAGVVALMQKPDSPIKFLAFDPLPIDRFATNANVVVLPLSRPVPLSRYRSELVAEVKSVGASRVAASEVRLPGGPAVRLTYGLQLKFGGRTVTTATTQYAFARPTTSVVVTYTTLPVAASTYAPIFQTSARSIRFS